jgi:hypothetical protein
MFVGAPLHQTAIEAAFLAVLREEGPRFRRLPVVAPPTTKREPG